MKFVTITFPVSLLVVGAISIPMAHYANPETALDKRSYFLRSAWGQKAQDDIKESASVSGLDTVTEAAALLDKRDEAAPDCYSLRSQWSAEVNSKRGIAC
ncbi:hypothetical protein SPBR_02141 [Sporothrix brasiliensis 5110]|uniref:Uncharacterized protein n=1 Tax=Sporothrix brasiliensis 5110 TaxID=1398154 RepID=A0A0C2J4J6_9PEZI|nr:uncharacterized protein SPBR_02141 [Sporothrix brasiliensis 5110]KIH91992.1 hypothetical protein SPBR_02141 [Sporothrix brasiliensis 5110]